MILDANTMNFTMKSIYSKLSHDEVKFELEKENIWNHIKRNSICNFNKYIGSFTDTLSSDEKHQLVAIFGGYGYHMELLDRSYDDVVVDKERGGYYIMW